MAGGGPQGQMMDVSEADTLVTLIVEDHDGFNGPILQNLDFCMSLRF